MAREIGIVEAVRVFFIFNGHTFHNFANIVLCMIEMVALFAVEIYTLHKSGLEQLQTLPLVERWLSYWCVVLLIIDALMENEAANFMYFAF